MLTLPAEFVDREKEEDTADVMLDLSEPEAEEMELLPLALVVVIETSSVL